MKIIEKINKIKEIKENIKTSIENKGIDTTNKKFEEYPTLIDSIETGGSDDKDYSINNADYLCYKLDNQNMIDFLCKNLKNSVNSYLYTFSECIGSIPLFFKFNYINKKDNYSSSFINPFGLEYKYYNLEKTFYNYRNTKQISLNIDNSYPCYCYNTFYYSKSTSLKIENGKNEIWIGEGSSCFSYSSFTELPTLNVEKCMTCNSMFQNAKVRKIVFKGRMGVENYDNVKPLHFGTSSTKPNLYNMFYNCSNLTSIKNLDLTNIYKTTNNNNMFYGCKNLKELNFEGTENLQINLDVSSTGLEREGLLNMLDTLPTLTKSITIKIGTNKMNLLTEEDISNFTIKGYTLA